MDDNRAQDAAKVEELGRPAPNNVITTELRKLVEPLAEQFPDAVSISFEFRKVLQLHIDVRTLEEAHVAEAKLPSMCGGAFSKVFHGNSPRHPFLHRVTAIVDR